MERLVRVGMNSKIWKFETFDEYNSNRKRKMFGDTKPVWVDYWKLWCFGESLGAFGNLMNFGKTYRIYIIYILIKRF